MFQTNVIRNMNSSNDNVAVKVLFFAKARELTGEKEVTIEVQKKILAKDLLNFIVEKYQLNRLKCNVILALNESWIDLESVLNLKHADEIAVIPPLSGEFGGVSMFIGTTRDNFEGKVVTKLEYEAYEGMAVKSLENICQNIRNKFSVGNIAIFHRLGDVPIQEASVVIAISSTHRKSALEAVPYAIDALKADVPIWKKEVYEGEQGSEWKENSECTWSTQDLEASCSADCLQLYEEVVEADPGHEVPPHLIQINANLQEINRRINCFISRKRQQINISNIQDFCLENLENGDESTCARVSAVLMRRKDSKSHLKVHRVENTVGPQTHGFDPGSFLPFREFSLTAHNCPPGAEERLANVEGYLNVRQNSRDVFSRLKAIEDKILYLESISPEYFDFDRQGEQKRKGRNVLSKRTYSPSELDMKMQQLEAKLLKKSNNIV